jgi:hypothetical protein
VFYLMLNVAVNNADLLYLLSPHVLPPYDSVPGTLLPYQYLSLVHLLYYMMMME